MAFSAVRVNKIYGQVYVIQTLIVVLILLGIAGAVVSFFLPESSSEQVA